MLKALELYGFKSFADKTRFEFPPGITVVVGPNGSGKSNIVDAIKWVLGEQSVKSLRGKEMTDVIFNGAAGRKPLNMAEVTLVFDNADRRLGLETPEVAVTRRVYRSGEGEYLLNRAPCRLRDFRDLFAGTGVATEAYSVIEQGKVDVLLQASPRDRRLIFEEAAGISRFKAKKLECQRRLERVDQNLLRLSDIVDEVENRLKTVRMQATKARRYQEYAERLQTLRTQTAWVDWREFTRQITEVESEQNLLASEIQTAAATAEQAEQRALDLETAIAHGEVEFHEAEVRAAHNRERVAALETLLELERGRVRDWEENLDRSRRQGLALSTRVGDLEGIRAETSAALDLAQSQQRELSARLADEERALTTLNAQADQLRVENEQQRIAYLEQMRGGAAQANEISALEAQLARSEERRERCLSRLAEVESQRAGGANALAELTVARDSLTETARHAKANAARVRTELVEARRQEAAEQRGLAEFREQLSRLRERVSLLEDWERRLEGVDAGVKAVLQSAQQEPSGPFGQIRGMLADLLRTGVDAAVMVEALLAEKSQALVYQPNEAFARVLGDRGRAWLGRVSFLPLTAADDPRETQSASDVDSLAHEPGIIGRVTKLLETEPEYRPLVARLFGDCWVVESLSAAWSLKSRLFSYDARPSVNADSTSKQQVTGDAKSNHPSSLEQTNADALKIVLTGLPSGAAVADLRNSVANAATSDESTTLSSPHLNNPHPITFVTPAGEVLWPDGAVTVGSKQGPSGIISRRSELRALLEDLRQREERLNAFAAEVASGEQRVVQQETDLQRLVAEEQAAAAELAEVRSRANAAEQRRAQLDEQYHALAQDARLAADQSQAVIQSRTLARGRLDQLQLGLAQAEARLQENGRRLEQLDEARQARNREALGVKVELARSEQRLDNLRGQLRQFEQDRQERRKTLQELHAQSAAARQRIDAAEQTILQAEQELAQFYLLKETFAAETAAMSGKRTAARAERQAILADAQRLRQKLRKLEEKLHKRDLAAEAIRHERTTLEDRLREDYAIELAQVTAAPASDEARERAAVDEEINDLRRKLTNLGGVNLEALQEAAELETRYENLAAQFQDLTKAKHALEQIIHKINADSRRLFAETLEQVKEHFQALFRKLFGGGRADIVLEEGVDLLESGIEIVARPPGKEPRNISLLSGGEKTLTCVALLLSIFRSRPSPFCVLDEVDAALDEANIERFVAVLKEFLTWTQFIVVTHSKKTMACGNTLYGVTMQESGISKRVSVRFEDVSDTGEIKITPAKHVEGAENADAA